MIPYKLYVILIGAIMGFLAGVCMAAFVCAILYFVNGINYNQAKILSLVCILQFTLIGLIVAIRKG